MHLGKGLRCLRSGPSGSGPRFGPPMEARPPPGVTVPHLPGVGLSPRQHPGQPPAKMPGTRAQPAAAC